VSQPALLPNRDLLEDALRAPRQFPGQRIWYRDQHLRGKERAVDLRACFRAALIRARRHAESGQGLSSAQRA
jgi:hypothetical protein